MTEWKPLEDGYANLARHMATHALFPRDPSALDCFLIYDFRIFHFANRNLTKVLSETNKRKSTDYF